jgi:hypothetical protein
MDKDQIEQAARLWRQGFNTQGIALRVFGAMRRWERKGFGGLVREINTEAEVYNRIEEIKAATKQ